MPVKFELEDGKAAFTGRSEKNVKAEQLINGKDAYVYGINKNWPVMVY